jgi:hypothetical protein
MLDLSKDEKQMLINAINLAVKASENSLQAADALLPIAKKINASMQEKPAES